jgi:hypothetical protein
MSRRTLTLALTALAGVAFAQQQSVTLSVPAAPLPQAVAELGKAAGTNLMTAPQLAREVVTLELKDAPLDEAMRKLAAAVSGRWVQESSGQRLVLDETAVRQRQQADAARRLAGFRKAMADLQATVKRQGEFDAKALVQNFQQQMQGGPGGQRDGRRGLETTLGGSPGGRAIAQLLPAIRAEDLAAIGPGGRVVWATNPTPMQKGLPLGALNVANQFVAEQRAFTDAINTAMQAQGGQGGFGPGMFGGGQVGNGQPAKVYLVVQRFGDSDTLSMTFAAVSADGQTVGNGFMPISAEPEEQEPAAPAAPGPEEKPIELSESAKQAVALINGAGAGGGGPMIFGGGGRFTMTLVEGGPANPPQPPTVTDDWRKRLLDPAGNEPLSLFLGEAVGKAGQGLGLNVVACLPDAALRPAARNLSGQFKPTDLLNRLGGWETTYEKSDGWLLVKPSDPDVARADRIDRVGLGKLLKALVSKGTPRLDDIAAYAVTTPASAAIGGPGLGPGGMQNVDLTYVALIDPAAVQSVSQVYGEDRTALVMFARMGPAQRQDGALFPVAGLGQYGLPLLRPMVFDSFEGPVVERPQQEQEGEIEVVRTVQMFRGRGGRGGFGFMGEFRDERTDVLPNGLPGDSRIRMTVSQNQGVKGMTADGRQSRFLMAENMGAERAFRETPNMPQGARGPEWSKYVPVTMVSYTIRYWLAPNVWTERQLTDYVLPQNAQAVGYDQLPKEFLDRVEASYAESKERMQNMGQRMQRGQGRQRPPMP